MKIYVAGPMTGLPEYNYPAFRAAAVRLRGKGHEVVNPVELGEKYGTADEINSNPVKLADLIIEELDALKTCDAIYLLPGWNKSKGTRKELKLALDEGLELISEYDEIGFGNDALVRHSLISLRDSSRDLLSRLSNGEREILHPYIRQVGGDVIAANYALSAPPYIRGNEDAFVILKEMMERDDLNGRDMVDNFHIEYGEYGGWDALELLKAYAVRLKAALEKADCAFETEYECEAGK